MFVNGGFLGLTGEECNARYPRGGEFVSPGAWRFPSRESNHWELFAFCVYADVFPDVLRNSYVVVHSDNMSAIKCVRDMTAALESVELAELTRQFLSRCVMLNCRIMPVHIPGKENILADPLSRAWWPVFGRRAARWCLEQGRGESRFLLSL